ncbi:restriction endonuclease subunit S [Aliivibrio finisterrensis]|uniref:restriction endonuclease subunit S n=1 Tax=Aliivibrio finisterrensis TaxID=511998 RepID=UPI00101FB4F4|nr:restriction endonuclease subunit S [Aliivibrio finisterrensis]RYU67601.1 restriction endonuclease subunit S [Aliivibrio finisterrensis]RYU71033.1 restriction endonuclease subunit S [Aliivibrio finisterrensis]RYU74595.1 restriction endonuclease subunit S [Aliivibrio finisterrensis]
MSEFAPEGWKNCPIGDVAKLQGGYAFKSSDSAENGTRWLKIANVGKGEVKWEEQSYLPKHFEKDHSNFLLTEGDSVVALTRPITQGELKVAQIRSSDVPALINQRVARVLPKHHLVERDFMYALLRYEAIVRDIEITIFGTDPPNVSTKQIEELKINLPPLPEQQKIAAILTSVDEVIEKTQAQINKLKDLKTGMMQELLTRGVGVDEKPHTEFKDSPVGRIPKGWEVDKLINLSLYGIKNGTFNDPKKVGKGYKLINVVNMYRGFGIDVDSLKLLDADEKEFLKNKVEYGDVFFTRSSLKLEGIAYCNINLSHDKDITYDGHLMCIRPDCNRILPKYLTYYCLSDFSRKYFMSAAKHSTMTTIGQADIAPLSVSIPPIQEQQKIVDSIDSIESYIRKKRVKLDKYKSNKKALMQDLLTGKVRVKVDSE